MELREQRQILDKLRDNYNNFINKDKQDTKQHYITQLMLLGDFISNAVRHFGSRGLGGPQFALIFDEMSFMRIDHTFGNLRENYRRMKEYEVQEEFEEYHRMLRRDLNVLRYINKELKAEGK